VLLARAAVRRACQRAWRARNGWTGQHGDGRVDVWARASWRQRERETTEGDHRICMGVVEGRRRQGRVIWRLWPVGVAFAFYLAAASRPKITPAQQYKYPATRAPRKALFFTSAYLPPLLGPSSLALATNDAHAWVLHFAQMSRPLWASPAQQPGSRRCCRRRLVLQDFSTVIGVDYWFGARSTRAHVWQKTPARGCSNSMPVRIAVLKPII
jgi:hypothetical protein